MKLFTIKELVIRDFVVMDALDTGFTEYLPAEDYIILIDGSEEIRSFRVDHYPDKPDRCHYFTENVGNESNDAEFAVYKRVDA